MSHFDPRDTHDLIADFVESLRARLAAASSEAEKDRIYAEGMDDLVAVGFNPEVLLTYHLLPDDIASRLRNYLATP